MGGDRMWEEIMIVFGLVVAFLILMWAGWRVFLDWMERKDQQEMSRIRREIRETTQQEIRAYFR